MRAIAIILGSWVAVSFAVGPLIGRMLARISEDYPLAEEPYEGSEEQVLDMLDPSRAAEVDQ